MKYNFSLIIPVYNTELYIEKCLKNIQIQTHSSYEVIIVDDGSEDNSIFLCQKYKQHIKNLTILRQENKGLSTARNTALDICKGKYVWFIDSDDFINDCNVLERIYNHLEKYSLDILQFNANFKVTAINKWSIKKNKKLLLNKVKSTDVLTGQDYLELMASSNEWRYGVWLYVFRKDFLLANNLTFEEDFIHEDAAFNVKCLVVCDRFKFVNESYYTYRIRPNSIMSKPTTIDNLIGYLQAYKSIEESHIDKRGILKFYLRTIYLQIVERFFYLKDSDGMEVYMKELENIGEKFTDEFNSDNLIVEVKLTNKKNYHDFIKMYNIGESKI